MKTFRDFLDLVVYSPFYIVKAIWIQLILLGSMFALGALIFMHYQGLDPLSALLGAVSTITTIGLYAPNIVIMPVLEKVLLIVGIIVSVGSAASLLQATFTVAYEKRVTHPNSLNKEDKQNEESCNRSRLQIPRQICG